MNREVIIKRNKLYSSIRKYFCDRDFTQVETAILQLSPGLDRYTRPMGVVLNQPLNDISLQRYLHTSPEFAMKRILINGEKKIFQICKVFRDRENSKIHHPEFSILEWYSINSDYKVLGYEVKELIRLSAEELKVNELSFGGKIVPVTSSWTEISISDAFKRFAEFDIFDTIDHPLNPSTKYIKPEAHKIGLNFHPSDNWEDIYHKLMIEIIEPKIAELGLVIVYDYPVCLGSAAKRINDKVCERLEVYIAGLELANGCSELLGADKNLSNFEINQKFNEKIFKEIIPIDIALVKELKELPECAGIALGIDRLLMLFTGSKNIKEVIYSEVNLEA